MDDIWIIIGSIVIMLLSSLSSVKKRKGNVSSVEETEVLGVLSTDDEDFFPHVVDAELFEQQYNNDEPEKFDDYIAEEKECVEEVKEDLLSYEKKDIEQQPEETKKGSNENNVDFDLRRAVIYSTILTNPYIGTEKMSK